MTALTDVPKPDMTATSLVINKLMPQGCGLAPVLLKRAPTVELDWDVRQKSRFGATNSQARALAVFLPRARWRVAATCWWPRTAR